ncbi:MAG: branched-chain amino acid aminotransferase, partial [Thermoleophilaceae bacterium]|nr:branched-chain amino acid aminotransferase [Thermoleophilaceae bacterium]
RKSVMEIADDLGYKLIERDLARAELALADEVFLTGTAAELTPMVSIDDIEIGEPGPVTRALQSAFEDALHGRSERYAHWLDVVPVPART